MQPGQPVDRPSTPMATRPLEGTVSSIGAGTGAEFALLPAQNATGNWVKVVQRVPVRIELDAAQDMPTLRAGMSARVEVDTGPPAACPSFATAALRRSALGGTAALGGDRRREMSAQAATAAGAGRQRSRARA